MNRLEQGHGANADEIYMEINCYRMAINCEYSDLLRVLIEIVTHPIESCTYSDRQCLERRCSIRDLA